MKHISARHLTTDAMLICLAMILSYVESLVPLSFAVPGIKMGLPNLVIVWCLYRLGWRDALTVSLLRVLLVSILFGSAFSLAYSFAGAVLSFGVMQLLRRCRRFSTVGVSVAGAVAHNAAQIAVAVVVLQTEGIAGYLPVLCLSGTVTGIIIGFGAAALTARIAPPRV